MPFPVVDAFDTESNHCFEHSRRLTGHNRFVAGPAAILETRGPTASDAAAHVRWRELVIGVCSALGWNTSTPIVRVNARAAELVIPAPAGALFSATEINEWAWEQVSGLFAAGVPKIALGWTQLHPIGASITAAADFFSTRVALEREPGLIALHEAANKHRVALVQDDDELSLGMGSSSVTHAMRAVPNVINVPWEKLRDMPLALVTGSNGKTTTVRLIAAMLSTQSAYAGSVGTSSTAGILIGGELIASGDYSGPAGARRVLRDVRVEAAVLETARGGILRRGLAVERADVAVVTNISADHFGEYGIDTLDDLAEAKLTVARALGTTGTLVLNADDPLLLAHVNDQRCAVALFALDDDHPALVAHRAHAGTTCGVHEGVLKLHRANETMSLGSITAMPLTAAGAATYNIANISAAVLAAATLRVPSQMISDVLANFGRARTDNPGRLERWVFGDVTVLIDYAHNPDGLARLLDVAAALKPPGGRLTLLLGQAGNRDNDAIAELVKTAVAAKPDHIVIKEIATMLRGRQLGELPSLIQDALLAGGFSREDIVREPDEIEAAYVLLRDARAGDVVVMPVHQTAAREKIVASLDEMERTKWRAGHALPQINVTTYSISNSLVQQR